MYISGHAHAPQCIRNRNVYTAMYGIQKLNRHHSIIHYSVGEHSLRKFLLCLFFCTNRLISVHDCPLQLFPRSLFYFKFSMTSYVCYFVDYNPVDILLMYVHTGFAKCVAYPSPLLPSHDY